jgi:hypothetical protein
VFDDLFRTSTTKQLKTLADICAFETLARERWWSLRKGIRVGLREVGIGLMGELFAAVDTETAAEDGIKILSVEYEVVRLCTEAGCMRWEWVLAQRRHAVATAVNVFLQCGRSDSGIVTYVAMWRRILERCEKFAIKMWRWFQKVHLDDGTSKESGGEWITAVDFPELVYTIQSPITNGYGPWIWVAVIACTLLLNLTSLH